MKLPGSRTSRSSSLRSSPDVPRRSLLISWYAFSIGKLSPSGARQYSSTRARPSSSVMSCPGHDLHRRHRPAREVRTHLLAVLQVAVAVLERPERRLVGPVAHHVVGVLL